VKTFSLFVCLILFSSTFAFAQAAKPDEKAEAVITRAVSKLGGDKYLQAKSMVGRGSFTLLRDGMASGFQTFVDVIVFPNRERTEFKEGGEKTVQANSGTAGWIFDGGSKLIKDQTPIQIENFVRTMRSSLDNLLRGNWRKEGAQLAYVGKRQAGIGVRNDVVKLIYPDGFAVEFEFTPDDLPSKALYKHISPNAGEISEEDRYAQFVDIQGLQTPFIIDHYRGKDQTSRINYDAAEFNRSFPDTIFAKPKDVKDLKKDLKF
jgi:hypothetical protein